MTPQAVGSGIAGAALLGGGGTLAAYAAGAFDKPTFGSWSKKDDSTKDKTYIGNNEAKIKALLGSTSTYKNSLKGVWDNMEDIPNTTPAKPTGAANTLFVESMDDNKKNSVSAYVRKWCEHTYRQELKEVPKQESDLNKNKWDAFKDACFELKQASNA
ncbi:hypothetical protein [Candidatus Mycoplasma haematohominis]|uniref:Uncharacterized protein n=1 Tax=Candidatus Mycoplasma haematohominis TaxID=1494318 RepID=A0A478FQE8_9MOLU|nr:hypothetical protein [Candidatus Mycoplasma haemohominis]GCE63711.1 hypothetical protein MHSWG343_07110 [Candidatus Mycoplasma haemohominis]